ncbi:TetR/AcrR family transcriptional regulator [Microbacterium lushaniae]|nr:TetR/AcrR family transcriptional regulator [Microbacterium lushaniae]KAA9154544.1 TetR/AcrR family transcriptional regulator [Microbacterium lushaniae]
MTTPARERRRERMRGDIVEATLRLIEAEGLDGVSIERIAEEAEVARATIYTHFPEGRDAMLRAAYDEAGEMLVADARAGAASISSWEDRIAHYARAMIEFSRSPTLGRFYSVTGPALVGFRETGGAGSRGYRDDIRDVLSTAQRNGELAPDVDPDALAVLISSSLRDAGIDAALNPGSAERYVDAVRRILRGLRATPGEGS